MVAQGRAGSIRPCTARRFPGLVDAAAAHHGERTFLGSGLPPGTGSPQAPVPGIEKVLDAHPSRPGDTAVRVQWLEAENLRSTTMEAPTVIARAGVLGALVWKRGRAAETGATCVYVLGAMVLMLLAQPSGGADRAHRAWRGLGPGTPGALWEVFRERFGVTLVDGFGSTETNLVIGSAPEDCRPGCMGAVRDGFEARVVDADLDADFDADLDADLSCVPDGTPGELVARTDQEHAFATGYLGGVTLDPGAWRRTGDRVVRDAAGWSRFVDRVKDCIRRRGENISSYEVENALRTHPDAAEAAAFPVPSALAEDGVMVAVVPRAGRALDPAQAARHCAGELSAFAVPRYVHVVAALPLTETGKVRKSVLRVRE
ncbi:hypothetical protein GCM10010129_80950 [Streptomyces fumigatiscleroticus]|nr:hypothetical protein GCM10010129_80950 [Streptomyces fumigatiscleroticus]